MVQPIEFFPIKLKSAHRIFTLTSNFLEVRQFEMRQFLFLPPKTSHPTVQYAPPTSQCKICYLNLVDHCVA